MPDPYRPAASSVALCEEFADQVPDLRPTLKEHIADYGEVLPHVFFGDVRRHIEKLLDEKADEDLRAIFEWLESAYSAADEPVENVISVSLLEDLWNRPEIKRFLGPEMTRQYSKYVT